MLLCSLLRYYYKYQNSCNFHAQFSEWQKHRYRINPIIIGGQLDPHKNWGQNKLHERSHNINFIELCAFVLLLPV